MRLSFRSVSALSVASFALAVAANPCRGAEGMWMPQQLPQIADKVKAEGLELDPAALANLTEFPMGAIVSLGGCSASFVSPQGLAVTNHHCVYGSLQYNSTADRNLIKEGFLAKTPGDELPAVPGSRIYVTVEVSGVTDRIIDAKTAKLAGKKRYDAIDANEKALVAECEKDKGYRCDVSSFYSGLQFYLTKQMEIRDVRLVYAPPDGVGKFGGDTDNWMWPRHTGDFGFYRAYVGKDGKPADFSKDNVPYQPRHHLKLAQQGVKEGDFVMVTGYPGRTNRYRLPAEIEYTFAFNYPEYVKRSGEQLEIIGRETKERKAAAIAYANTIASINNYYKNRQGMLDGYARTDFLQRKQKELQALKAWVQADASRRQQYAGDLAAVEKLVAQRNEINKREFLLTYTSPRLLNAARRLYRTAVEKAKPNDMAREPGFQERDWPETRQGLDAIDKRYDAQVDEALAAHFLAAYLALPAKDQDAAYVSALGLKASSSEAQIKQQLDTLYAGSQLNDKATRLAWMDKDVAAFKASDDRFIKAAVALYADDIRRENRDKALSGDIQRAYSKYMQALIAFKNSKGEAVYPDANSTLRVTYGKVAGRSTGGADGTAWSAFTTLRGVLAKNTGEGEFDAPKAQLEAIKARRFGNYYEKSLDSVSVDFLATLDITGGNSGSPVLNSRAELVGLAFDGTLDSVLSDWDFNPVTTRTIAVDARYMLWQMSEVDKAENLVREMQQANTD